MNINLILILLIIFIISYYLLFKVEKFENTNSSNDNDDRYKDDNLYMFKPNEIKFEGSEINSIINNNTKDQCIINRVLEGNKYVYKYKIDKDNTKCYDDMNQRCIKTGDIVDKVPFNTDKCTPTSSSLGSCRRRGFECVDFKSKNDCSEYNMEWSPKTCAELLERDIKYPDNISSIL
jgi:hypothetical protein